MNYDVSGASSTPGPNAPLGERFHINAIDTIIIVSLGDLCGTSSQPTANAQAAVKQWTAAGFPANKVSFQPSPIPSRMKN
jgi:chitinase